MTIALDAIATNPYLGPVSPYTTEEKLLIAIERLKELAEATHDTDSIATMILVNAEITDCLLALD